MNQSAPAPSPAPSRFEPVDADQVRDPTSGLTWSRAAHIADKRLTWDQADAACKALTLGGHADWRLPTRAELLTLVDDARFDPSIDPIFECKPDWYWTATAYAPSPGVYAWLVLFGGGNAYYYGRDGNGFVRAVRGGQ